MAQRDENIPTITLNNTVSPAESPKRRSRIRFTGSQRLQLEKAFEKNKYLTVKAREDLALTTGASVAQIQKWFQYRRTGSQQKNKTMIKSSSQVKQPDQPKQVTKSVGEKGNLNNESTQQPSTSKSELDLEKIKSAGLRQQLNDIRAQYDNLVFEKNKVVQDLEEKCLMVSQLNDKVQKLNHSNEELRKHLSYIGCYVKKIFPQGTVLK